MWKIDDCYEHSKNWKETVDFKFRHYLYESCAVFGIIGSLFWLSDETFLKKYIAKVSGGSVKKLLLKIHLWLKNRKGSIGSIANNVF